MEPRVVVVHKTTTTLQTGGHSRRMIQLTFGRAFGCWNRTQVSPGQAATVTFPAFTAVRDNSRAVNPRRVLKHCPTTLHVWTEYHADDLCTGQETFALVTRNGSKNLYSGEHSLIFSRGHGPDVRLNYTFSS